MDLGHYRLMAQRGAGPDGASYRAQDRDGAPAEVRVLGPARADIGRWPRLARRLRLAALLDHPAATAVRELALDHEPPFLVLEPTEGPTLAEALAFRLPLDPAEAVALAGSLAACLAAAHRLGLVHGRLGAGRVRVAEPLLPKLDFTGLDTATARDGGGAAELDASCRAPEAGEGEGRDGAGDVYALGALVWWLLTGRPAGDRAALPAACGAVADLVRQMLAAEPADRPPAREVEARMAALPEPVAATRLCSPPPAETAGSALSQTVSAPPTVALSPAAEPLGRKGGAGAAGRERLGRFRLLERLGQGGMGTVYRAEDSADGTVVAVKVLRPDFLRRPDALRRFHKEARILAEVNNPYVTNLLEVNEDDGTHYLVIEYVAGRTLGQLLDERGPLDEKTALAVVADVARGLAAAHDRGIVHRDIKPANVLLVGAGTEGPGPLRVKLSDFGLARHVVESESLNLTQDGAVVGTPLYMAPEQGAGEAVGPPTDVYSLGATLFHLLAGRPPFTADSALALIARHRTEPPPSLARINPAVSEGTCRLVEKALAKSPEARYAGADDLLGDLERLLRGEPTALAIHPRLPPCDPANVLAYDFVWELESSPRQLWPYVSNTERLNRAAGLPAVRFTTDAPRGERQGLRRFGRFRKAGLTAAWEEHPFEWVEARRMGVLREYTEGPFKWLVSTVDLEPRAGGGTTLRHRVQLEPHGLLGRTAAAVEVGVRGRRALDRIYRRVDAFLTGKLGSPAVADPFEEPAAPPGAQRRRLDRLLDRLGGAGVVPDVAERLGDFLVHAPAQEVARIRPLALARRLGLDPDQVVAACLHGAREGLLVLLWDILCPVCRIPSEVRDTLRALREHGRCEACGLDFELDFANSVELIFRAHPEVRATELGVYCVGGPAHSPHVVAQVRVGAGERVELDLALSEGAYRLRGPQLPYVLDFRVDPSAPLARWDLDLARGLPPDWPRALRAGRQVLALANESGEELLARLERAAPRADALTAARASTLALFRELFPGEVLAPGQLVSVATVTLLVTDLDRAGELYEGLGDARAFTLLHEHFRLLDQRIRRHGGAVVKTVGEGVLAAFSEPMGAVQAALGMQALLAQSADLGGLRLRVGVHRGPAMAATFNDQLDYYGATVRQASRLPGLARGGEVILTQAVAGDPQVAALLAARGLEGELLEADLPGAPLLCLPAPKS
jgi:serine/threonine protein kinase/class 3 adenylate cyclase